MEIRVREECRNCNGSGDVNWVDHKGMTRDDPCEGTGWIEEWRDMETTTLREYLMLLKHDQGLIAIHEFLRVTVERMDRQAERIERLEAQLEKLEESVDDVLVKWVLEQGRSAKAIERLEQIILNMAKGCETTPPDDGPGHTHWVYPLNKAQGLIKDVIEKQTDA